MRCPGASLRCPGRACPRATLNVALASPAGSATSGPVAVPSRASEVRTERLRSRGNSSSGPRSPNGSKVGSPASSRAWASVRSKPRSVRPVLREYSALAVDDSRHLPRWAFSAPPSRANSVLLSRVSGSPGKARRMSVPPSIQRAGRNAEARTLVSRSTSPLSVAETSPRMVRLTVPDRRTSCLAPTSVRKGRGSIASVSGATGCKHQVALAFVERVVALDMEVERGPLPVADDEPRRVGLSGRIAALGRHLASSLGRGRIEAAAKDDVHHPLVGGIAIFERDFLRQDFHPLDRLGREVAKLAKSGDALAVEQHDRPPARPAARAPRLRCHRVEQFADAGRRRSRGCRGRSAYFRAGYRQPPIRAASGRRRRSLRRLHRPTCHPRRHRQAGPPRHRPIPAARKRESPMPWQGARRGVWRGGTWGQSTLLCAGSSPLARAR